MDGCGAFRLYRIECRGHLRCLALGILLATGSAGVLLSPVAQAQPATSSKARLKSAKSYVDAGLEAQSRNDYDTAIMLFEKAYELVPHPVLLYNIAQAHRLAGRIDEAETFYQRFLAGNPTGAEAQNARDLLAEIAARKAAQARQAAAPAAPVESEQTPDSTSTGDTAAVSVKTIETPSPPPPRARSPLWKVSLGTSAVVAISGLAYAWYAYDREQRQVAVINASIGNDRCRESDAAIVGSEPDIDLHAFRRACTWHTRVYFGYAVGAMGAIGAIASLIVLTRDPPSEPTGTGTRHKKSGVTIVPRFTVESASVSLQLHW